MENYHDYAMKCGLFMLYESAVQFENFKDGYFSCLVSELYEYAEDRGDLTIARHYSGMHPGVRIAAVDFSFSRHYPKGHEIIVANATFYNMNSSTGVEVCMDSYETRSNAYRKILLKADRKHWGFHHTK